MVSLSFSDYFDDINDRKSVVEFKKIVERLDVRSDHVPTLCPTHMPDPWPLPLQVLRQQSKALQVMADYS